MRFIHIQRDSQYFNIKFSNFIQTFTHRLNSCKLYLNKEKSIKVNHNSFDPIRGSQYYLPDEQKIQKWLQKKWQITSNKFGFHEFSMPVVAYTSIFHNNKSNINTLIDDEHYKELYTFKDKKGRNLSLRGDITPQFMSMLKLASEDNPSLISNIQKWFTIADCWRYERPSLGRRRNHIQWNADIIGNSTMEVEIELLSLLIHFFKSVGLTHEDVRISLNHRNLTKKLLSHLGIVNNSPKQFYKFCKILDKYKKIDKEEFNRLLLELGFTKDQCSKLLEIVNHSKTLLDLEKIFNDEDLQDLKFVINGLSLKGYSEWLDIDLTIVRGNDYYTGIVFECLDRKNPLSRSLAGGGRYDNYFNDSDKRLKYSAGFGMGNIAIINLIKAKNLQPKTHELVDVFVFTPNNASRNTHDSFEASTICTPCHSINEFDNFNSCNQQKLINTKSVCSKEQRNCLNKIIDLLRTNDISVYQYYKTDKINKALKSADSLAKFALFPAINNGRDVIILKNLATKTQEIFDINNNDLGNLILKHITL